MQLSELIDSTNLLFSEAAQIVCKNETSISVHNSIRKFLNYTPNLVDWGERGTKTDESNQNNKQVTPWTNANGSDKEKIIENEVDDVGDEHNQQWR